jgi:CRP/FNR family transcriptional regulator, cyclic AMP receptor protein
MIVAAACAVGWRPDRWGRDMNESILAAAADLPVLSAATGTVLITEGEFPGRLLILESGSVEVTREDVSVAFIEQPGALFGELSFLLDAPATATARAAEPSVFRIAHDPAGFLRARPEVAIGVATMLGRRVDALTRYLVDLKEQYASREDHLGVVDLVLESLSHHQAADAEVGSDRESEAPY